jgi:hypothetical protein
MRDAPPSSTAWQVDGHLRGHSPQETMAYLDWVSDYADEQQALRAAPLHVISPVATRWRGLWHWLRGGGGR